MTEVQTQETPQSELLKKRGMKSTNELKEIYQSVGVDGLTTDELIRYRAIVDLEVLDANRINALEAAEKSTRSRTDRIEKYRSQGRELVSMRRNQETQQERCTHFKGGRGLQALQDGGTNASDYAVIKHFLPNGELWIRCLRCGKTWKKPHTQDFATAHYDKTKQTTSYDPLTPEQSDKFAIAMAEYKRAVVFPTENTTSSGVTFVNKSADGNVTADNFVHEVYKETTLR
jgi:hypothetical protein